MEGQVIHSIAIAYKFKLDLYIQSGNFFNTVNRILCVFELGYSYNNGMDYYKKNLEDLSTEK